MVIWIVLISVLISAAYWFSTWADRIADDSEGMVDPGSREPYGNAIWSIITGK